MQIYQLKMPEILEFLLQFESMVDYIIELSA